MDITVDIESPEPLFAQLVLQIKEAVSQGHKKPGDQLPSIRQLANDLDLNSKTVAKAYRLLERDSVIQTRGYRGTFIHPDAVANTDVDINQLIDAELATVIGKLRAAGATDSELRIAFSNVMKRNAP